MLIFNFHDGLLIILLLSVFIQVSISEKYNNFQCVSFHEFAKLRFKIILKDIPDAIEKSLTLKEYPTLNSFFSTPVFYKTDRVYETVSVHNPPDGYLLYVKFYYHNDPNNIIILKPLMRFILQKNDVDVAVHRNCSSDCVIEFADWDWDLANQKHNKHHELEPWIAQEIKNSNKPDVLEAPQKIYYRPGDQVIIEAVYIYNTPVDHHVWLFQSHNNDTVKDAGNGVMEQGHVLVFNKFNFTLCHRCDGFRILLGLNSSTNNRDEFQVIELLHFIKYPNITTKNACMDKCKIWYDLKPDNKQLSDLEASAVCPPVQTSVPSTQRTTLETTEGTKTSTGLTTTTEEAIKTYEGTTITTTEETTVKTNSETAVTIIDTKPYQLLFEETTINPTIRTALNITDVETIKINTAKILAIVLPIVAVVVVIIILVVIYWYRRDKAPKAETEDTYLYATQLNYVQLELESSDLYEAPKKDYVSVYTRIIGVLKPKSS